MGFSETKVRKSALMGSTLKHTFVYNGDKTIKRVHPLCDCVKFNINHPEYTFWFKVKSNSNKIIVITYNDESKDFLELQAII